jgi:hypothetical protein
LEDIMAAQKIRFMSTLVMVAALAACGGGDGGSSETTGATGGTGSTGTTSSSGGTGGTGGTIATAVDKYVGTWTACFAEGGASDRENLVITKTGDTTLAFSFTSTSFASADCSGSATGTESGTGTATLVGTKQVAGQTVDKVNVFEGSLSEKQIFLIGSDGKFYTGYPTDEAGSNPDAEGYPGTIDPLGFTKV